MSTATAATRIGSKTVVEVAFTFGEMGYAGLPYWAERATLIDIGKEIHPRLKGDKRKQALQAELDKRGLSQKDYERLVMRADRKFYTDKDADDGSGEIIIPRHVITGMLGQVINVAPKNAIPKIDKGMVHIAFQVKEGFLRSGGKTKKDAKDFNRFVKNEETNQRRYESTPYLPDFVAQGVFLIDESIIKQEELFRMFEFGGRYVGIGSCRTQGYGHFLVSAWDGK